MRARPALAALLALAVAGCTAVPAQDLGSVPPRREPPETPPGFRNVIEVDDPFEAFNRGVYAFNADFDRKIFLPVVRTYETVTPEFLRGRVSDFFNNLEELRNALNGLLQARPEVASRAVMRFLVNSTVGVLGLFDVADTAGLHEQDEDFGQTLGWWGVGPGPYLVLPILGPSGVRDGVGLAVDRVAGMTLPPAAEINDLVYAETPVYGIYAVDQRSRIDFRYYDSGSPFEYDLVRLLYRKQRQLDVER